MTTGKAFGEKSIWGEKHLGRRAFGEKSIWGEEHLGRKAFKTENRNGNGIERGWAHLLL
jgi:hypothetical protein